MQIMELEHSFDRFAPKIDSTLRKPDFTNIRLQENGTFEERLTQTSPTWQPADRHLGVCRNGVGDGPHSRPDHDGTDPLLGRAEIGGVQSEDLCAKVGKLTTFACN